MRHRRGGFSTGGVAIGLGVLATRFIPKTLYNTLARLIPIPNIPEEALIIGVAIVIAGLVYLTIVAGKLIWQSRQAESPYSGDSPPNDGQPES